MGASLLFGSLPNLQRIDLWPLFAPEVLPCVARWVYLDRNAERFSWFEVSLTEPVVYCGDYASVDEVARADINGAVQRPRHAKVQPERIRI